MVSLSESHEPDANLGADIVRYDADPAVTLEQLEDEREGALRHTGYGRPVHRLRTNVEVGRRTSSTLQFAPGCHRIDVLVGAPARRIQVWNWMGGGLVARAEGGPTLPYFSCGPQGTVRLDVEGIDRQGTASVRTYGAGRNPVLEGPPLAAGRLLSALFERGVVEHPRRLGRVEPLDLRPDRLVTRPVVVAAASCVAVVAATGSPSSGVDLRLREADSDVEIQRSRHPHTAFVKACSPAPDGATDWVVELRTDSAESRALFTTVAMPGPPR
jgi:hypothetical protein